VLVLDMHNEYGFDDVASDTKKAVTGLKTRFRSRVNVVGLGAGATIRGSVPDFNLELAMSDISSSDIEMLSRELNLKETTPTTLNALYMSFGENWFTVFRAMNRDEVEVVRAAAQLRDLAALNISADVLEKAARLTANVHLETGTAYSDLDLIKLRKVLPVVIAQLRNDREKSQVAKIIEVAEEYESLVSGDRNKPIHPGVARGMVARAAGGRFDEQTVAAFEAAFERGLIMRQEVTA